MLEAGPLGRVVWIGVAASLATVGLVACSAGQGSPEAPAQVADPGRAGVPGARVLPVPGGRPAPGPRAASVVWDTPVGWTQEPPAHPMRRAQYRVPGPAGDGECVVFYFGPGQGGDPMSNAQRWAGQFTQPDGRASEDLMRLTPVEDGTLRAVVVEVAGTYSGGMSSTQDHPNYLLLGGIVEGPDAPWFFKFVGPEATVQAHRDRFMALMKSVRVDG